MRSVILAIVLLLTPSLAEAAPKPMDFAYGAPLSREGSGAVYRLSVPREVYEAVTRDDLSDIRVFNSRDAAVPHALRLPGKQGPAPEYARALPFFPLYEGGVPAGKEGLSMQVEQSGERTMIHVVTGDAGADEDSRPSGYLIDARKHKERIHELRIAWKGKGGSLVVPVSVESSRDLTHWSSLVPRSTLVRMEYQGHEIRRDRIPLPDARAAWFRLRWLTGPEEVTVTGVQAVRRGGEPEPERHWTVIEGAPAKGDERPGSTAYEYESPALLPVDRVRIRFPERNTLVRVTLYSRPDPDAAWRRRRSGVFYHLRFDETSLVQDTATVGPSSDRFWKVAVEGGALSDPGDVPGVELGWRPYELLFVAQGEGPFMLAYGSARLDLKARKSGAQGILTQVMGGERDELIKKASALPGTVLGGPDMLVPAPPPPPWRTWLLWAVLVLGVGVIAGMAVSLGKGMRREE